jgi:serine protease Do
MRKFLFFSHWIAAPLLLTTASRAGPFTPNDLPDLVERISPSAVHISTKMDQRKQFRNSPWGDFLQFYGIPEDQPSGSLGTGFLIDTDGSVLTNYHVIEQAAENRAVEIVVSLRDKRQFSARILGRDPKTDIALLQIRDKEGNAPANLSVAKLGDSDKVRIGEPVVAIGNPFGLDYSVSAGIISSKNRNIGQGPFDNFLQTDAAINPGNSGGPLFNTKGEVIGINSAIFSKSGQFGGIGFAIPINDGKNILASLKKFGRVPRPWLGVVTRQVNPTLAYLYGLPSDRGLLILNLVSDAPANREGLRAGDIITEVSGRKVQDQTEIERELSKMKPFDEAMLTIQRANRTLKVRIKLEEFPPQLNRVREGVI